MLDPDACYGAVLARDARFDGLFFCAVATTGVYCRPICPARTPGRDRCSFFRLAAEAEKAGYRACFRCRPELAPGGAPVDAVPRLVARALAHIEQGYLNEHSVAALAAELGVTDRHLRRAVEEELGVSPVELAQSRRLGLAKQLLADTALPLTEIAFASGFQSVRRFNALFQSRFGRSPSSVRRGPAKAAGAELALRLDFRPPLDWPTLLGFLGARAIPGVEHVDGEEYRRVVRVGQRVGVLRVRLDPKRSSLRVALSPALGRELPLVAARVRELFDLDARPLAIEAQLKRDPKLAPLVRRRPGLRIPGAFDPFESVVRALLGQQISVRAATTLAGRIAARFGQPYRASVPELSHAFPSAAELARVSATELAKVGLPGKRAETLRAVSQACAKRALELPLTRDSLADLPDRLQQIPGVGAWTAEYLRMRVLHHPDAFPAGDLGLRRALGGLPPRAVSERAAAWSPWRAYAAMHLWSA